ncbi:MULTISPECIES: CDP-diacylglycerol--glycerol-3-phosphate 3-phosphatidyltransferase [Rhodobacterales]|jgi:CDP-diacylglycerol--glycerol-3-phosphate 3-phosphatidyltransferase|uniref:CDP-diacylglycerol--glycerol-3-phosphate 3-phosphatidyltransferase n=1 Tax=Phaeobacter gallaeciensis TaxID=60890 RepID=A0A1B0ZQ10_9RHOB|nr:MULTISPECIES: CDP-diacylglycerol--glycerol-3-phosphate 3-phosphatidyltransferase [Phaeobacter]MDF1772183.1 CDP-diacylglycerol--glycerol-3-phosphate 3-phosphatidyltransferase [Pseudophaeobacter sp. bin_em_oilr2.035]ANP36240.1 CDP-diacylglycerol--glycerol-3-phosphate 3-phosphatidyltransferase [Phaeobacter gallaeciensis]MDE4060713.1 CDP-diacylglycerol--glycerol-3-phosphate 3-phosphatidyltransferase [Phaeobacter gallaeciensis]MDE4097363.1 CDP-diacylglycerol--glycerol-3-phosphate 3-phosphatidyltr
MTWTLPNILTIVRLLAAPGLAIMFLYFSRPLADWFALLLFVGAAVTDWFDGYLARAWKQETKIGAMLDPIADKAMVVIALMILVGYAAEHWAPWLVLPATVILFREVFVSGLREYLGDTAGTLKVTKLAKWKTTAQMTAIATLFCQGVFEHYLVMSSFGMDDELLGQILAGEVEDVTGLRWKFEGMVWTGRIGLWLLWIAAALTLITGADYLKKALPFLKETR